MIDIFDFLTTNKDGIVTALAILGAIGSILAVLWGAWKLLIERWWKGRLRWDIDVFEVITDPNVLLPKLYLTENDDSPLADHRISYRPRNPEHDLQAELKSKLSRSRYLLITAPTGYGKTREAGVLAQALMHEGWRVLRIKNTGWLDTPKALPKELSGNRSRILVLLDDLNGLFSTGERTQDPRAEQMPIFSQVSYHDRLLQVLDMLEGMCTENEIRVVATARSENEQWQLLGFNPKDKLWKRFERVEISEIAASTAIDLLSDVTRQVDIKGDTIEFKAIARKSDGTYRNILLNLRRVRIQNKPLTKDEYIDTLEGSWQQIYEQALKRQPAVKYVYAAIDLLKQVRLDILPILVEQVALLLWGGNVLQIIMRRRHVHHALHYLTDETMILRRNDDKLQPSDGQIEARGETTNWLLYVTDLEKLLLQLMMENNQKASVALINLGAAICEVGQWDHAELLLKKMLKITPDDPFGWGNLGVVLETLERYPEAEDAYRRAIEKDPNLAIASTSLGKLLVELKRYTEAEYAYRQAIEKDTNNPLGYYNLGNLLEKLERYPEAEDVYSLAIEKNPKVAFSYVTFGDLLKKLERYPEAEDVYRQAIGKDPNFAYAYYTFGDLLKKLERYPEAEDAYRQAIGKDPNFAFAYYDLGDLFNYLKRYPEAENAYRQTIEKGLNLDIVYSKLGSLLEDLERYPEAEDVYRQAIEKNPNNFNLYLAIAFIKKILGEDVPRETIQKARQLIPEDDWYNQVCLESVYGNFDLAFEYLQRASQLEELDRAWAWEDRYLTWLRNDPRFLEIVGHPPIQAI